MTPSPARQRPWSDSKSGAKHLAGLKLAACAVTLAICSQAPAGESSDSNSYYSEASTPADPALGTNPVAPAGERRLRGYAGIDVVSMYVSRGLIYSDRISLQPWVEVHLPVARPEADVIDEVGWFAGNWNSIQPGSAIEGEAPTRQRERLRDWYEADLYSGFRVAFAERWTASLRYNYYTSPSDSFSDLHELDSRLAYDDAHWWPEAEGFALRPSLRLAKTTRNRAGPTPWYLEAGVRPGGQLAGLPGKMSLSIPLIVGFGADGQYLTPEKEHHFGFFQTGVAVSMPMEVLPESAGAMNLSGGFDMIAVRDRELNFRGDRTTGVARIGLDYSY